MLPACSPGLCLAQALCTGGSLCADRSLRLTEAPPALPPAGSLAIPLAVRGANVYATDISSSMAGEAAARYEAAKGATPKGNAVFEAKDLE